MHYVYSTLAADTIYTRWVEGPDLPILDRQVLIRGGANVVRRNELVTPLGVRTVITDEDLEVCEKDPVFQLHKKNGHITVRSDKVHVEVAVAGNMQARDVSDQRVPQDFKDSKVKVVVASDKDEDDE